MGFRQGGDGGGKASSVFRRVDFASHLDTRRGWRTLPRRLPEQAGSSSMNSGYEVSAKLSRSTEVRETGVDLFMDGPLRTLLG
jgi:hypothetical protein